MCVHSCKPPAPVKISFWNFWGWSIRENEMGPQILKTGTPEHRDISIDSFVLTFMVWRCCSISTVKRFTCKVTTYWYHLRWKTILFVIHGKCDLLLISLFPNSFSRASHIFPYSIIMFELAFPWPLFINVGKHERGLVARIRNRGFVSLVLRFCIFFWKGMSVFLHGRVPNIILTGSPGHRAPETLFAREPWEHALEQFRQKEKPLYNPCSLLNYKLVTMRR